MPDKDVIILSSLGIAFTFNLFLLGFFAYGEGQLLITALASYEEDSTSVTATVSEFVDVSLTNPSPDWSSIDPGDVNETAGTNPTMTISSASATNLATDIYIRCTNFTSGDYNITPNYLYFENDAPVNFSCDPAYDVVTKVADLTCPCGGSAQTQDVDWMLSIPSGQAAGSYTSTAYICLTKDGTSVTGSTCS